jgi:hypothetical protein
MSETRLNAVDSGEFLFEADAKPSILRDDDQYLVVKAVLASEIVQPYRDQKTGKLYYAYKPADELEKATLTFRGVPIKALSHPKGSHIEDATDANGRVENPSFRKDLLDPKTKRPCRRGIVGEYHFYRDNSIEVKTGNFTPITEAVAQSIRDSTLRDNSIGFSCINDPTSGEWQGQHFDVVQRRIFGNHVAAPIEKGRCPSPYCGINMADSAPPETIMVQDIDLGISFSFDKTKFTDEQAAVWVEKQKPVKDCPICDKIVELGALESANRIVKVFGAADALLALEDAKTQAEIDAEKAERAQKTNNPDVPEDDAITANRKALLALHDIVDLF